jgi:hypothetical protein
MSHQPPDPYAERDERQDEEQAGGSHSASLAGGHPPRMLGVVEEATP